MTTSSPRAARSHGPASLRRRLARHYLPFALSSVAVLVLFMNVSFFDANRYPPPGDIFTEGAKAALPDGDYPPRGADRSQHDGATMGGRQHDEPPPTTVSPDASGGHIGAPAGGHGGGPASSPSTPPNPPNPTAADDEHAGDQESVLQMRRYSTATGYVATAFLGLTLLIGPANLLRRRPNPVSGYLRRDIGLWTAVTSGIHVVFGLLVKHGDGQLLGYFLEPGNRSRILTNSFGLANWAGLGALVVLAGLAVISNDAALRRLKAKRWKQLQRFNYALFALVVLHSVLYGALWRTTSPYTVLLGLSVVAVASAQAIGIRLWRQRRRVAAVL